MAIDYDIVIGAGSDGTCRGPRRQQTPGTHAAIPTQRREARHGRPARAAVLSCARRRRWDRLAGEYRSANASARQEPPP